MTADLTGLRVLVTGGATGVGAGITEALLAAGAAVAVVQRTGAELDAALSAAGLTGRVHGIVADLAAPGTPERAVADAIATLGGLDALVNNAAVTGPPAHRAVLDLDDEYLDRMLALNLSAVVRSSAAAARHLAQNGGGTIVTISSVLAHAPAPAGALYSATKAAVIAFTRGLALELGSVGVRAVTVSPGDIATSASVAPPAPDHLRAVRSPALGRRGEPGDIGAVVAFLVSPGAAYITGTDILVDGGFLLG